MERASTLYGVAVYYKQQCLILKNQFLLYFNDGSSTLIINLKQKKYPKLKKNKKIVAHLLNTFYSLSSIYSDNQL